jgi:spore coat polysaccharide biosynthesis protein SpsF
MTGTIAIIQARMSSSRLPGKVLMDIGGQPMLMRVIERVNQSKLTNRLLVATTSDPTDDTLNQWCKNNKIDCFRGSMQDVLDRYYQAARTQQADRVVRITADCPVIDPELIDATIRACIEQNTDFAATRLPPPFRRTYPIGLDVEVSTFAALERAWQEAKTQPEREHVFPYLYDQPGRFKIHILNHEPDNGSLRWTVDTAEDLELIREIFHRFLPRVDFGWMEILDLMEREPELMEVNAAVKHKSYMDVDELGSSA